MGGVVGGRAKTAWTTREYLCTASGTREKEKVRSERLGKRGEMGFRFVGQLSPLVFETQPPHPPPSRQRQGRVGTFFIKVSLGKRRRVSISFLSIYAQHTSLYRHTRNTSMIFPSPSIEPRSTDRSIDRWNMEKLSRSVVSKGKRNGRAGHRRRRVPLEREGITISRATSTYSPFVRSTLRVERHRRENGRTKLQRAALHAAKLAIAYYIIHEWRSFRRARIGRATRFLPSPTRLRKTKTTPRPYNLASFSNKLTTYAALRRASLS